MKSRKVHGMNTKNVAYDIRRKAFDLVAEERNLMIGVYDIIYEIDKQLSMIGDKLDPDAKKRDDVKRLVVEKTSLVGWFKAPGCSSVGPDVDPDSYVGMFYDINIENNDGIHHFYVFIPGWDPDAQDYLKHKINAHMREYDEESDNEK